MSDDTDALDRLNRRNYLRATGAAALGTAGLAGCVGRATGTLATHVTDQPADIGDFESLLVTIEGIWLGPEGAVSGAEDGDDEQEADGDDEQETDGDDEQETDDDEQETDDDEQETDDDEQEETAEEDGDGADDVDDDNEPAGREYYEFDEPQEADLVQLQGEETQLIDDRELSVASYQFLQLHVSDVDGTLADGGEATVDLPGNAPLTFNQAFEVREDTRTSFTADFAPVRRGTGSYLLRPVPQGIDITYEETADN